MKNLQNLVQKPSFLMKLCQQNVIILLLLIIPHYAFSETDTLIANLFDMPLEDLMNQEVSIATKSAVSVKQAPAVISVITREEIENLPVRTLTDLLQLIPGFEITPRLNTFDGVGFRGVKDNRYSSRFLVLLDGQPYNYIFYGNSIERPYRGVDINSIEKIEIIRGPGSALYGRNAFSAVINIITKTSRNYNGLHLNLEQGSFNTYRGYLSYGKKLDVNKNFLLSGGYHTSDGTNTDALDEFGRFQRWNKTSDNAYLTGNLTLGDFSFYVSGSLSTYGHSLFDSYDERNQIYYSANYSRQLSDLLRVKATVFGHNVHASEHLELYMPNDSAVFLSPSPFAGYQVRQLFPDGFYLNPYYSEYIYGANFETELLFTKKNQLLTGIQANAYGVYDVELQSNINLRTGQYYNGYTRGNLLTDTLGWFDNGGHNYTNFAWYVQDIWYPIPMLGITAGFRLDFDSQIGPVFNPRLGLTWLFNDQYNLKLLYGSAYRAPSPSEQYQTLGYAFGNQDLKPETINTIELAFQQNLSYINNQVNIYYNVIGDMIYAETITSVNPANSYYNLGTNKSYGIEVESRQKLSKWLYTFLNYSYNVSENTTTIEQVKKTFNHVDVAPHKFNAGINGQLPYNFRLMTTLMYRSKMEKFKIVNPNTGLEEEKSLDPVGNYTIINSKLVYKKDDFPVSVFVSVYNLLDTKYYSQDNERDYYPPMPGISYLAGVSLNF